MPSSWCCINYNILEYVQISNDTDLQQRVEILEVEVEFLSDEVEEIEVDVNQLDDEMTVVEDTVIGNTEDIAGEFLALS